MMVERRASDLGPMLWPGAELAADPDVVSRYEKAPDLPGPIQAVGTAGEPVLEAWCPQCHDTIGKTVMDYITAVSPITVPAPTIAWPGHKTLATLITLQPCGHTFRAMDGQTIAEVREPTA